MSEAKMSKTERAIILSSSDVTFIISTCKAIQGMTPRQGQSFMASIWMKWRAKSEDLEEIKDGVGMFFDLYFSTYGNFDKMRKYMLDAVPEEYKDEIEKETTESADGYIKLSHLPGDFVDTKLELVAHDDPRLNEIQRTES
jgi:hypothetical protein